MKKKSGYYKRFLAEMGQKWGLIVIKSSLGKHCEPEKLKIKNEAHK